MQIFSSDNHHKIYFVIQQYNEIKRSGICLKTLIFIKNYSKLQTISTWNKNKKIIEKKYSFYQFFIVKKK